MNWWNAIVAYYKAIGEKFQVDPVIFVGIHIIATPLFAAAVAWIIYNKKKKRSILWPSINAAFIFNAANIYLILFGENIPWWVYTFVGTTTLISSYFTIQKIKKKIAAIQ